MEPPTKRPRFGPGPFEDEDPDEDELVSRPEEVNARRDPGLRFERSRAFAAYKLKSAFESIFEKYGRDFDGVGDEIELSTGKIIVNNGHLQSLKDATEIEQDDENEDDEEDNTTAAPRSLIEQSEQQEEASNEPDHQRQPGQKSPVSIPPPPPPVPQPPPPVPQPPPPVPQPPSIPLAMASSYFGAGLLGMPPMIPNLMYPPHMQYGAFPMPAPLPYGAPLPMPTMDPTWQIPDLPMQVSHGAPISVPILDPTWQAPELPASAFSPPEPQATPKRKKTRQSLSTATENDGTDIDDIVAKNTPGAARTQSQEKPEESSVRKTVLLPRPAPQVESGKKKRGTKPKSSQKDPSQSGRPVGRTPAKKDNSTPSSTTKKLRKTTAEAQVESRETLLAELTPSAINNRALVHDSDSQFQEKDYRGASPTRERKVLTVRSRLARETPLNSVGSDVYIDLSHPLAKSARKPQNQSLRVEIISKRPTDVSSYRAITPDTMAIASSPQELLLPEKGFVESTESAVVDKSMNPPDVNKTSSLDESKNTLPSSTSEVFTRNNIDTEYGFSDEDEPLPKRKQPQATSGTVNEKAVNTPQLNVQPTDKTTGTVGPAFEEALNENKFPQTHRERHRQPSPEPQPDNEMKSRSCVQNQTASSYVPYSTEPSNPKTVPPPSSEKWRRGRPKRRSIARRPSQGPVLEIPDSDPAGDLPTQEELYESIRISSPILLSKEDDEYRRAPSPTLSFKGGDEPGTEVPNPDIQHPPEGPTAQDDVHHHHHHTTCSPTFPSAEAQEDPAIVPKVAAATELLVSPSRKSKSSRTKKPSPSTPIKTPRQQTICKSQPRPPFSKTPAAITTHATSAKRKNNILSLLSDSEDELSIMSPITHMTPTIRSSPASHHVRLFPYFSNNPISVGKPSATLKRDALILSASKASALRTPGTSRRSNRKSKGISGSASGRRNGGMGIVNHATPSKGFMSGGGIGIGDDLVVETPGGTVRRCGENGFRCDRDFCFGCL